MKDIFDFTDEVKSEIDNVPCISTSLLGSVREDGKIHIFLEGD
jgi:hypothetical protein